MFDDDFPVDEQGLPQRKVDELAKRLADVIDRLYSCDYRFPIDNDEIHCSITAMAEILGVTVPDSAPSIKFKMYGAEYVEEVINENLYKVQKLYSGWSQSASLSYLVSVIEEKKFDLLSVGDIADFCYSDYFKQKCEEYGNVL